MDIDTLHRLSPCKSILPPSVFRIVKHRVEQACRSLTLVFQGCPMEIDKHHRAKLSHDIIAIFRNDTKPLGTSLSFSFGKKINVPLSTIAVLDFEYTSPNLSPPLCERSKLKARSPLLTNSLENPTSSLDKILRRRISHYTRRHARVSLETR